MFDLVKIRFKIWQTWATLVDKKRATHEDLIHIMDNVRGGAHTYTIRFTPKPAATQNIISVKLNGMENNNDVSVSNAEVKSVEVNFTAEPERCHNFVGWFTDEFVQTNATPDRPEAVTFNIKVTKRVVLDESSTVAPSAAEGVEVQVKRTINADEWSTICLPFAMSEEQLTATFGSDVELADFISWTSQEDGDGAIVAINVSFAKVTAMEANHPYIIKVSEKVDEFTVKGILNITLTMVAWTQREILIPLPAETLMSGKRKLKIEN